MPKLWQQILLSPGNEDHVWELFHENSKLGEHRHAPSDQEVRWRMGVLHDSLPYEGYPVFDLPRSLTPLKRSLVNAIISRKSVRDLVPCTVTLKNLATLLHYAYGVTRDKNEENFPRGFRVVPSGGGLFPLEIFFHCVRIKGMPPGIYHYNPAKHQIRLLQEGDETEAICKSVVQSELIQGAALVIFITALFERSVFKYGDRGYRFVLLEAGHVAQNINLVANALGLNSVNIGGFFDRKVDDVLKIDGVTHSTIYLVALGKRMRPRAK